MATPEEKKLKDLIDSLIRRVGELENWKVQKERQQITLPLDEASKNVINNI